MSMPPSTARDFDHAYAQPFTPWGDIRIPPEIAALVRRGSAQRALELGCGVGRFSRYVAQQGVRVTGVDFSAVAIGKAKARVARDENAPEFLVGDVTDLTTLRGPYDFSFDVGCFHCLDPAGQHRYAGEVARLLQPGGTHLIWALDHSPADEQLSPERMRQVFESDFQLQDAQKSRRRLVSSHWYWLSRAVR